MIELHLMRPSKETENKLRWVAEVEGVKFQLYIPKWRVPKPWPGRIAVSVDLPSEATGHDVPQQEEPRIEFPALDRPIRAVLERVEDHTQTVRFRSLGDPKDWELGEPYIPYSVLPDQSAQQVLIEVRWVGASKGQFG